MLKILHCAFTLGLFLTTSVAASSLCQSSLETKIQRVSAEGSAKVLFLCDGIVVYEHPDFRAPAYSPDRKFIIMHQVGADDDLQLYLFPTDENGLPDDKRSFGAFGGRYSGFIA